MTVSSVHFTSENQKFNTPHPVVNRLRSFDQRGIWLDPCSNETSIVGARHEWRIERGEDGLARPWSSDLGPAFCNPVYDDLRAWAEKMAREAARHIEIVGLIPARLDTEAFQLSILPTCSAIFFWKGRLHFIDGPSYTAQTDMFPNDAPAVPPPEKENGAPFPSCLPYWGSRPQQFLRAFESAGWGVVCR